MSFFRQVNILFVTVLVFIWTFGISFAGGFAAFALMAISTIIYPCSMLCIFLYLSYEQKLKQSGYKQSTSIILISFGILTVGACILLAIYFLGYLIDSYFSKPGFDYKFTRADFRELGFYISILVFFCIAASAIRYILDAEVE